MADRLTIEHYVGEAFVKCGQVILGSRILPTGPTQRPARDKRAGRWFLLELEELEGVGKEVELWRRDISSPLVVEILLAQGAAAAAATAAAASAAGAAGGGGGAFGPAPQGLPGDPLLERWTLAYERGPPPGAGPGPGQLGGGMGLGGGGGGAGGGSGTRTYLDEVSIYKRLTILIRSLYSYTRVLPAYKLFRAAKRSPPGSSPQPQLYYRISRSLQPQGQSQAAPVARTQDFLFAPVDTPGGRFRVAVQYNPAAGSLVLEQSTAVPISMPYTLHENYVVPGGGVGRAAAHHREGGGGGGAAGAAVCGSAPSSSGMARQLPSAMSASVYGVAGRSPPGTADAAQRHLSGGGAPGAGPGSTAPAPTPTPARCVVRQSWSSKDMKVSFSLPPPHQQLGSPGGPGLGLWRRSSSGYGSNPSTSPAGAGRAPPPPPPPAAAATGAQGIAGGPHPHQPQQSQRQQQPQQRPAYVRSGSSGCAGPAPATAAPLSAAVPAAGGTAPPPSSPHPSSPLQQQQHNQSRPPGGGAGGERAAAAPGVPSSAAAVAAAQPADAAPAPAASAFAAAACQRQQPASSPSSSAAAADGGRGAAAGGGAVCGGDGVGGGGRGGGASAVASGAGAEDGDLGPPSSGAADRATSLPVKIPGRSSSRTRSVSDLQAPAVYGGFEVRPDVAAATAAAASEHAAAAAAAAAGCSSGSGAAAAALAHARLAPGSAPAAPRGMLGLALGALKPGGGSAAAAAAVAVPSAPAAISSDCSASVVLGGADVPRPHAAAAGHHPPRPPLAAAAACSASPPASGGGGGGSQPSQALAVVRAAHGPQHTHQQYQYQYHRHMSLPHGSPPGGVPVPVPMAVGSMPPYGSPQLPFAFTPSAQSVGLASLHQAMVPLGYFGGHGGGGPSGATPRGAVSGRDVSCLALIRRPSWGSRSGSLDPGLASAGAAGAAQPLPSPLYDLLESSLSNASTPPGGVTPAGGGRHHHRAAHPYGHDSHDHHGHHGHVSHGGGCHSHGSRREPSSSSASAIFAFSPTSALPVSGSSPRQPRRSSAGGVASGPGAAPGAAARARAAGAGEGEGEEAGARGGGAPSVASAAAAAAGGAPNGGGSGGGGDRGSPGGVHADSTEAANAAGAGVAAAGDGAADGSSPYDMYDTCAAAAATTDPRVFPLARQDSDADLLPFALDQEGPLLGAHLPGAAAGGGGGARGLSAAAAPIELTLSVAQSRERDVAVGAFVRMMAEAAPLAVEPGHPSAQELSGRQALAELAQLREALRAALAALPGCPDAE